MGMLLMGVTLTGAATMLWTITKVVVGLGFVIFIHELGHFLAAKACGVKCEKFYVGFDVPIKIGPLQLPSNLGRVQWGETEYGIGIIPLGGYVKMLGQDDDPRQSTQDAERERMMIAKSELETDSGRDAPREHEISAAAGDADPTSKAPLTDEELVLDPRSFPAKPVWQRMIIISAGVIMNLISAVFMAAFAYGAGVQFRPCEISGSAPGEPAWEAEIGPGDMLLQLSKEGEPDEHLRFLWELRQQVHHAGFGKYPMDILVRHANGETKWHSIVPSDRLKDVASPVSIGVRPPFSNRLSKKFPVQPYSAATRANPKLEGGDRILNVDGRTLDQSTKNEAGDVRHEEIEQFLTDSISKPVTLKVQRGDKQLEVIVPPAAMRMTGLSMEMGPLVAVRQSSPGKYAGFMPGDVLRKIDGEPVGDPMTLPQRFLAKIGQEVQIEVERRKGDAAERVTLTVAPKGPAYIAPSLRTGSRLALESIGVAYSVHSTVAAVDPNGPAAGRGIQAGDKIVKAAFVCDDEDMTKDLKKFITGNFGKEMKLSDDVYNWPGLMGTLQALPDEVDLQVTYERNGQQEKVLLSTVRSEEFFDVSRGFNWDSFERIHTAESWSDAFALGFRETKEKFLEVLSVLKLLFTGRVKPTNLGGPIAIAAVAGSEASKGIPRLLLFLTFLSCNLAILNFLPIPALDGGHMVFLVAEAVLGRPVDEKLQTTLTIIGVCGLLCLMVFVFGNDIRQMMF